MKTKIESYIKQYRDVHEGDPWYGDSLRSILDGIEPAVAIAKAPGNSNIIRLLWHCIKWRQSLIERLKGTPNYRAQIEDPDNWLEDDDPKLKNWAGALEKFEEQFAEIITLLAEKNDDLLEQEFHPGRTYKTLIEGVIQHDIYHFGQIALLGRIMG